jgi:NAD(P)-dependent dehydrogenase (short-subunit alcohol dehydrogenase family)
MTHHFIRTQKDSAKPVGTIISVASGRAGLTTAGGSAYNVAKIAEQRLSEHVHLGEFGAHDDF